MRTDKVDSLNWLMFMMVGDPQIWKIIMTRQNNSDTKTF